MSRLILAFFAGVILGSLKQDSISEKVKAEENFILSTGIYRCEKVK